MSEHPELEAARVALLEATAATEHLARTNAGLMATAKVFKYCNAIEARLAALEALEGGTVSLAEHRELAAERDRLRDRLATVEKQLDETNGDYHKLRRELATAREECATLRNRAVDAYQDAVAAKDVMNKAVEAMNAATLGRDAARERFKQAEATIARLTAPVTAAEGKAFGDIIGRGVGLLPGVPTSIYQAEQDAITAIIASRLKAPEAAPSASERLAIHVSACTDCGGPDDGCDEGQALEQEAKATRKAEPTQGEPAKPSRCVSHVSSRSGFDGERCGMIATVGDRCAFHSRHDPAPPSPPVTVSATSGSCQQCRGTGLVDSDIAGRIVDGIYALKGRFTLPTVLAARKGAK